MQFLWARTWCGPIPAIRALNRSALFMMFVESVKVSCRILHIVAPRGSIPPNGANMLAFVAGLLMLQEWGSCPASHTAEPPPLRAQARLDVHQVRVVPLGVRSERAPRGAGRQQRDREAHLPPGARQGQAQHPGGLGGLRERRPRTRRQRLPLRGQAGGQPPWPPVCLRPRCRLRKSTVHLDTSLVLRVPIAGVTGLFSPPCPASSVLVT